MVQLDYEPNTRAAPPKPICLYLGISALAATPVLAVLLPIAAYQYGPGFLTIPYTLLALSTIVLGIVWLLRSPKGQRRSAAVIGILLAALALLCVLILLVAVARSGFSPILLFSLRRFPQMVNQ
ncbi:MAG: hypothetical protein WCI73_04570 [Phycisphaerae bacterium]